MDIHKFAEQRPLAFEELLRILNAKYSENVIGPTASLPDIYYKAGQRSVVLHLQEVYDSLEDIDTSVLPHH